MIDPVRAQYWISEYKKFHILRFLTEAPVEPSYVISRVWQLHMGYMPHYRRMTSRFYQKVVHYQQRTTAQPAEHSPQAYQDTLAFYADVFQNQPP